MELVLQLRASLTVDHLRRQVACLNRVIAAEPIESPLHSRMLEIRHDAEARIERLTTMYAHERVTAQ